MASPRHPPSSVRRRRNRRLGSAVVVVALLTAVVVLDRVDPPGASTRRVVSTGRRTSSVTASPPSGTAEGGRAPKAAVPKAAVPKPAVPKPAVPKPAVPTSAPTSTAPTSTGPTSTGPTSTVPISTRVTGAVTPATLLTSPGVRQYLATRRGDITAALYDVDTGTTSMWRPGVALDTASIVKVDILATLLHEDQDGDDAVTADERALATTMIEESDNDSATALWDDVGANTGVAAFNRLLPLAGTVPGADGYWGLTTTTAADQVTLLRAVALPGPILDAASRRYELGLMENVEADEHWGVSGGVPSGVTVALKNGWLPDDDADSWHINSIGWIDGDGRNYVLAVLSDDDPTEAYGIATIEGLSALVWAGLAP